jgi:FtsH-binding integral membrane protein
MNSTKSNLVAKNKKPIFKNNNLMQLFKLISEKRVFFALILATLVSQLSITYYVSENVKIEDEEDKDKDKETKKFNSKLIGAYVAIFVIILILAFITMPPWLKFILFSLFSTAFGVILGYRKSGVDPGIVKSALVGTASIFVTMFTFGVALIASGIKLGFKFGLGLLIALFFLVIVSIVQFFIAESSLLKKILVIGSLMVFSLYIMYDTNNILQRNYSGDFITASLDYYLDIINIFSGLLSGLEFDD